jgi:hypothetical protein
MGFYQDRKIEAQKARITELEALLSQTNEGYAECIATREDYRARIDELERMLAVHRLAVDVDAMKARIAELKTALNGLMVYGCPACNGDCSAANPPVIGCPMEAARAAYLGEKE